ncbi:MAG: DNA repair protein RecO [Gammaproteobacteria bacterium]|nr:DNA repair protein RecO [Gammaproteobacteria bacterium]MCW5583758.1 DNA repair protein RecO [Gammaproteobacteria bacterium]
MKRVLLQPAYVLHRRSYRESSFLVELFTSEHGRFTVVARGARKSQSSSQGLLQPFVPLLVSWTGKGELMTLVHVEANGIVKHLHGECLFAGFYLNELLVCLLQRWDSHPGLYIAYEKAVSALQTNRLEQKILRSFEKCMIEELGYGILPKSDVSLKNAFLPNKFYKFVPEHGFILCEDHDVVNVESSSGNIFSGKDLIAIAQENWSDAECLVSAKRLIRSVLAPLLGSRPIYSRQLFMQIEERKKHEE